MSDFEWQHVDPLESKSYICGHCGHLVASERGWEARSRRSSNEMLIYICHNCGRPTLFDEYNKQWPDVTFGNPVKDVPDKSVLELYQEARRTTGIGSYTATVLCCRKLLMHIAVLKGAPAGQNFVGYVEYLADHHFVPLDAKEWVDHIRKKGNEANHEIVIMSKDDAAELLSFVEMLLKVIFEFPAVVKRKLSDGQQAA